MPYTDTTVNNLIINVLDKDTYDGLTPSDSELYLITDDNDYIKDFPINVSFNEQTTYWEADKTYAEILDALNSGYNVYIKYVKISGATGAYTYEYRLYPDSRRWRAQSGYGSIIFKGYVTNGSWLTCIISEDGSVSSVGLESVPQSLITYTSTSFSSLPQTFTVTGVDSQYVVVNSILSNPAAQTGDWTITTSDNSVTVSGSISGTTTLTLYLDKYKV